LQKETGRRRRTCANRISRHMRHMTNAGKDGIGICGLLHHVAYSFATYNVQHTAPAGRLDSCVSIRDLFSIYMLLVCSSSPATPSPATPGKYLGLRYYMVVHLEVLRSALAVLVQLYTFRLSCTPVTLYPCFRRHQLAN
jgi:hypothetical protein